MTVSASIGSFRVGDGEKPLLIAGPCVVESEDLTLSIADAIARLPIAREFNFVFKASYLKDNRSSGESFRGLGIDAGLRILEKVRARVGCPILSDVHDVSEVAAAAGVLDVLQIPAFLSRQTSLIEAAGATKKPVNVKKGQFLAPEDMANVVAKIRAAGARDVFLTERGTSFGYHDLVVDFRGFVRMRATGCPVIFDVTHSLQRPGGSRDRVGGRARAGGDDGARRGRRTRRRIVHRDTSESVAGEIRRRVDASARSIAAVVGRRVARLRGRAE